MTSQSMSLARRAISHIARANLHDRAVVVVTSLAAEDVVGLAVAVVDVVADLAARIHGRVAENATLLAHLFRAIEQTADGDLADAVKRRGFANRNLLFDSANHLKHSPFLIDLIAFC